MAGRRVAPGLLLGTAAALLLLGAAELTLRLAAGAGEDGRRVTHAVAWHEQIALLQRIYRQHAYLNTAPRESGEVSALGKAVALNSLGYRSPERPAAKPDGALRILAAGGSTTFDVSAPDNAATWPQRLEESLRAAGRTVEVWNAGFPGWTSLESLIALEIRDLDLHPDLILYYHGINDLQPAAHLPFDPHYERGHADIARRALGFELEPPSISERSFLLEALRRLGGPAPDPWRALAAPGGDPPRRESISAAGIAAFARNLRSFAAVAQAHGARLVLVTQPMRVRSAQREADLQYLRGWYPELEPAIVATELEKLNAEVRTAARSGLGELLDAASGVVWQDEDFADPLHTSEAGRERLLAYLEPRIADLLSARGHDAAAQGM